MGHPLHPAIIIPAAGECKRFKDLDIALPKRLLSFELDGIRTTMIEHIIGDFSENTFIGVKNTDQRDFQQQLGHLTGLKIIFINPTRGQSETILNVAKMISPYRPVIVINCDNAFKFDVVASFKHSSKYLAMAMVFKSDNHSYSYVNDYPEFTYAKEKSLISSYAMAGAYYFKTAQILINAIDKQLKHSLPYNNEYYLSECFRYIPKAKLAIILSKSEVHLWGTPEELANDPKVIQLGSWVGEKLEPLRK